MNVYLDASVLIAYLYPATADPIQVRQAQNLFVALETARLQATVAFYSFSELYGYVDSNSPIEQRNDIFRSSLVKLFSAPLIVKPFVDRTELAQLRRRFTIGDSTDVPHVVAALAFGCSAIITFDHHFQQVREVIPVFTPDAFLATLDA